MATLQQYVDEFERQIASGKIKPTREDLRDLARAKQQLARAQEPAATKIVRPLGRIAAGVGAAPGEMLNLAVQGGQAVAGLQPFGREPPGQIPLAPPPGFARQLAGSIAEAQPPRMFAGTPEFLRFGAERASEVLGREVSPDVLLPPPELPGAPPPSTLGRTAAALVAPTAGAIGGQYLGRGLAPFIPGVGPALPAIGEALGSGAGYLANVGFGVEPFSLERLAESVTAPPVTRGLTYGVTKAAQTLAPKTRVGKFALQEEIRTTQRMASQNADRARQQMAATFEDEVGKFAQQTSDITGISVEELTTAQPKFRGIPVTERTPLSPQDILARGEEAGGKLKSYPALVDRMQATVQKRLTEGAERFDKASRNALTAINTQVRRKAFYAEEAKKEINEYLNATKTKAIVAVRQRERANIGRLESFQKDLNPPTPDDVQNAYTQVRGIVKSAEDQGEFLRVPRAKFNTVYKDLLAYDEKLAADFPELVSKGLAENARLENVSFTGLWGMMQRLGQDIQAIEKQVESGVTGARAQLGTAKTLYGTLAETMDAAAKNAQASPHLRGAAQQVLYANHLNKQLRTAEDLSRIMSKSITYNKELGTTIFDARAARNLLVDLDENVTLKKHMTELGTWDSLLTTLDEAAKSGEEAMATYQKIRAIKPPRTPRQLPTEFQVQPEAASRIDIPPLIGSEERQFAQKAGTLLQERAAQVRALPRTPEIEPTPQLPRELVTRPGSGGEIYRGALQAVMLSSSLVGGLDPYKAAGISLALLPGHIGYWMTTHRGQKAFLKLMRYSGTALDDNVAGIIGAAVRAGVGGFTAEEENTPR